VRSGTRTRTNTTPNDTKPVLWGEVGARTLKKALLQCGQSPGFSVWSKAAADCAEWRKLCGQVTPTPRPKPIAFDEQVRAVFYGPPLPLPPLPPLSRLPRLPPTLLSPPPSPLPQWQLEVLDLGLGLRSKSLLVPTWTSKLRAHSTHGTFDQLACKHELGQCDRGRLASPQEPR
jgi:hypothetical protein